MHIVRTVRACWRLFTGITAIVLCVALFVTLLAQATQPGRKEYRREQQRVVQEQAAEKAKTAERCAYLTSGTFTEADFKEFTAYLSVLWMKDNDPRGAFPGFVEDQCKWPQDFLAKAAAVYFDTYRHRKQIEADLRQPKPQEADAAAQSLPAVEVQITKEVPAGWVTESHRRSLPTRHDSPGDQG